MVPMADATQLRWPDASMSVISMSALWGLAPHVLGQETAFPGWFGDQEPLLLEHFFFLHYYAHVRFKFNLVQACIVHIFLR